MTHHLLAFHRRTGRLRHELPVPPAFLALYVRLLGVDPDAPERWAVPLDMVPAGMEERGECDWFLEGK